MGFEKLILGASLVSLVCLGFICTSYSFLIDGYNLPQGSICQIPSTDTRTVWCIINESFKRVTGYVVHRMTVDLPRDYWHKAV